MKRILVILVTYKPEEEILKRNIEAFIDYVDKILIWENTPLEEARKYRYVEHSKIEYVGNGKNSGLSLPFNYALNYGLQNGYDFMMTMDQDSIWQNFEKFRDAVFLSSFVETSIFCPSQQLNKLGVNFEIIDKCINSGSFASLKLLYSIGGYANTFFLDAIDHELCARAMAFGTKIIKVNCASLQQQYGSNKQHVLMGIKYSTRDYSAKRLYGLVRNTKMVTTMYPNHKGVKRELRKLYLRKFIFNILFFENNKFGKIFSIIKGYIDGKVYGRKYKGLINGYVFRLNDKL